MPPAPSRAHAGLGQRIDTLTIFMSAQRLPSFAGGAITSMMPAWMISAVQFGHGNFIGDERAALEAPSDLAALAMAFASACTMRNSFPSLSA